MISYKYYNVGNGSIILYKDLAKIELKKLEEKVKNASFLIESSSTSKEPVSLIGKDNNFSLFKCNYEKSFRIH